MPIGELSTEDQAFFNSRGENAPTDAGLLNGPEKAEEPKPETEQDPAEEKDEAEKEEAEAKARGPVEYEKWYQARKEADRERKGRRRAEQQLAAQAERIAKAEGRLEALMSRWGGDEAPQAQPQARRQVEAEPDREKDYQGWLEWKIRDNDRRWEQLAGERQQRQQQTQVQGEYERLVQDYTRAADEFRQDQPDFDSAYEFAMRERTKFHKAFGYSQSEAARLVQYEEAGIVKRALAQGHNPAEAVYQAAVALGYKPGQAKPAESVAAVAAGQRQRGLGSVAGSGSSGKSAYQTIAGMSEEDFAKLADNPRAWRKALGGAA